MKFKYAFVGALLITVATGFGTLPSVNMEPIYLRAASDGVVEKIFLPKDSVTRNGRVVAIIRLASKSDYFVVRTESDGGRISRCFIKEGDRVRSGQRLFEIQPK